MADYELDEIHRIRREIADCAKDLNNIEKHWLYNTSE